MCSETTVIEIHPGAKYVIATDDRLSDAEINHLIHRIREWWEGDFPFAFIAGDLKLIRVDELETKKEQ